MWWRKAHADTLLPGWADVLEIITEKAMPAHQALTAKREALPRVACHRRGDVREIAQIAQKGTWRGPNVDDPEKQTLNEQKGGQGDEWARVEAQVRSEDLQAKEACDHNQRRRECPVLSAWRQSLRPWTPKPFMASDAEAFHGIDSCAVCQETRPVLAHEFLERHNNTMSLSSSFRHTA